jgi:predicted nucleic acid-binding protein
VDAFDSDVLVYAAQGEARGITVRRLFEQPLPVGTGSVLLLPELLPNPARHGKVEELYALQWFLARLELLPVDLSAARLSALFAQQYKLRAADAAHLACAVNAGADRFITNNRKGFSKDITEIHVTYPEDLG